MSTNKTSPHVRQSVSKLHSLLRGKRYLRGTPVTRNIKCGKSNCKCAKGDRHVTLYISRSKNGKSQVVLVPRTKWDEIKEMVQNYKEMQSLVEVVSDYEWEHIKDK